MGKSRTKANHIIPRWAERLECALAEMGYDREQLAAICKVSLRTVHYWIAGRKKPDVAHMTLLCKALNLPLDAMLTLRRRDK